jgi:hypothetical protein
VLREPLAEESEILNFGKIEPCFAGGQRLPDSFRAWKPFLGELLKVTGKNV